jgi:GNAT superfamily N-acetyltransferase
MTRIPGPDGFEFDDDPGRIDRDVVWSFLSTEAYWSRWRTRELLDRQLDRAWRLVGGYQPGTGRMVAFARAFSDEVAVAYLADVFVLPEFRGHRLGVALVDAMITQGPGASFRWMLHTNDAHDLYRKFNFAEPDHRYLERPETPHD